jgi:hypothetical protein
MMLISFVLMCLMLFDLLVNYVNQFPHVILISLITVVLVHRPFIITSRYWLKWRIWLCQTCILIMVTRLPWGGRIVLLMYVVIDRGQLVAWSVVSGGM